jgi:hypothetical protein
MDRLRGGFQRKLAVLLFIGLGANADWGAVNSALQALPVTGEVENVTLCRAEPGSGSSFTMRPLEMAVSPLSAMTERSNVALKAGSSKPGNIMRA